MNPERRGTQRYPCNGFAEALVPRSGLLFRGKIRDISESGCFISTALRRSIELDRDVILRFALRDSQFEVQAKVSNVRKGEGFGLRFSLLDLKSRSRLTGLCRALGNDSQSNKTRGEESQGYVPQSSESRVD